MHGASAQLGSTNSAEAGLVRSPSAASPWCPTAPTRRCAVQHGYRPRPAQHSQGLDPGDGASARPRLDHRLVQLGSGTCSVGPGALGVCPRHGPKCRPGWMRVEWARADTAGADHTFERLDVHVPLRGLRDRRRARSRRCARNTHITGWPRALRSRGIRGGSPTILTSPSTAVLGRSTGVS